MAINKSEQLEVRIESQNEKMHYMASCDGSEPFYIDYVPPMGDGKGYTSLEVLLIALSSCITSTVGAMLRNKKYTISKITTNTVGYRRSEHPTVFKKIIVDILFCSNDVKEDDIEEALHLAKSTIAPVWYMLKNVVEIEVQYKIAKN